MSKMHILFSNVKMFTFETSYDAKNMHFLIKSSNTENLNPPGPLLWDRVARIVHDIGHFDKNESNLEKMVMFRKYWAKCVFNVIYDLNTSFNKN